MIPATFGYTRASTIDDAVAALASSDDAKVLGGGQSLLPVLRLRLNAPELVVDCSGIDEIKSIDGSGDRVVIGSPSPSATSPAPSGVMQTRIRLITEAKSCPCAQRGLLGP